MTSRLLRRLWRAFAVVFGVVAVLVALAIGLFRVLVPMVPDYHERIEHAASTALGYPVTFERIDARWRVRGPELVFEGATVYDGETGAVLVSANDGYVNLDVGALVGERKVVPDSVLLRGVDIELVRAADGRFEVFAHRQPSAADAPARGNWRLPDGRFELRDARLRYVDGDAEPIEVPDLEMDLEVDGNRVRLDGTLVPPESMGDGVELSAELDVEPGRLDSASWQLYAAGSDVDLAAVAALIDRRAPTLTSGRGDAVLWAGFVGSRLTNASLELDVADVVLAGAQDAPRYDRLSGRFEWDANDGGWSAVANDLYLSREGRIWPHVDVTLDLASLAAGGHRLRLRTPFLRIEDLQPVLASLPDSDAVVLGRELAASGEVHELDLELHLGADGAASLHTVEVRAERLGWSDRGRIPGIAGLSGTLRADRYGGRVDIDSEQVVVRSPELLRADLEAWRLTGAVVWRAQDGGWQVMSDRVLLGTRDFDALSRFTVVGREGAAPEVDLDIELGDVDIARTREYLPVPIMKPKLVSWLDYALQGGTVRSASLKLDGPLDRFPFEDDSGLFNARLEVDDVDLGFARDWPLARGVDAVVEFTGRRLDARVSDGRFGEIDLSSGTVSIPELGAGAVLEVAARSDTRLQDVEDYFLSTPAASRYTGLLDRMEPSGPVLTEFEMSMPLGDWPSFDYRLGLDVDDAVLGHRGWDFALESLSGKVVLTRNRVDSEELGGLLLGRPVELLLQTENAEVDTVDGPQPVAIVVASARGRTDANVLGERLYAPLAEALSGSAAWNAQIRFPPLGVETDEAVEVRWQSDLAGMAATLPAPIGKPADDHDRPLDVRLRFPGGDRMSLDLSFGSDVHTLLELGRADDAWTLVRGDLALGGPRAQLRERPGLSVRGNVERFDLGAWLARRGDAGLNLKLQDLLRTADVSVKRLTVLEQHLDDARVKIDRNVREWLVEIESDRADGAVFYPFDPSDGTPVIVNMQRLYWQTDEEDDDAPIDPRELPAMRIDVQDFALNAWRFGALTMALDPAEDGIVLQRCTTTDESFSGSASGVWRHAAGPPSEFRIKFDSTDVQATAVRLNVVEAIDADQASMELDLRWDEYLDADILREVYGTVAVRIGEGKLVTVDPKAGRVFGLMSITALPRRLSLDFSDIFGKGFAFDAIEGDFALRNGSAHTENLTLRGPAAQVGIVGRAGIADRDYDQTAIVYANFGSSLPIAGAIAGGPAVGAALLIFSEVFKDPLKEIGRVDYRITGSWDDPIVARAAPNGGDADTASEEPVASNDDTSPSG